MEKNFTRLFDPIIPNLRIFDEVFAKNDDPKIYFFEIIRKLMIFFKNC